MKYPARKGRRSLLALTLNLLLVPFLSAQEPRFQADSLTTVPRLVSFAGKAVDDEGKTLVGTAGVSFAIYKDQVDGAPLWTETRIFRLMPGATTAFNWVPAHPKVCPSNCSVRGRRDGWGYASTEDVSSRACCYSASLMR